MTKKLHIKVGLRRRRRKQSGNRIKRIFQAVKPFYLTNAPFRLYLAAVLMKLYLHYKAAAVCVFIPTINHNCIETTT